MDALNRLCFRTGVYTAQNQDASYLESHLDDGLQVQSTMIGKTISAVNVFHSDLQYFAATAAVQLLTVLVILMTYWQWWKLGRHFSFSPLEIAKVRLRPPFAKIVTHVHAAGIRCASVTRRSIKPER